MQPLSLQSAWSVQGDNIKIRPCIRPGERLAPAPVVEVSDKWVDGMYPVFQVAQKLRFDPNTLTGSGNRKCRVWLRLG